MREKFLDMTFQRKSLELIETANSILDDYRAMGYDLSLRQLYYQFVSRNVIENSERSYKRLGDLINNARLAGLVDWEMIRDRSRDTVAVTHWDSPADILETAAEQFRIDKWRDQPNYVEVMVEKQALEGVLIPVCRSLDVRFSANKGYSSASAFYEAGKRFRDAYLEGKACYVLYLGDHDPSGIDMTRDARERLELLSRVDVTVDRLALNMDQVREYDPPENPAKTEDSRYALYREEFGHSSWELDALEPTVLAELVRTAVSELRDELKWEEAVTEEKEHRRRLHGYAAEIRTEERSSDQE